MESHQNDKLQIRLMLPDRRHPLPIWEVRYEGQVIGWVEESRRRSLVFQTATGVHPITGERVCLESSTDKDERVRVVLEFWLDPLSARQHLPWNLRRLHGLER